jgi:hypothetical protein
MKTLITLLPLAFVQAGDTVPLTLVVEGKDGKKESLELKVPVKALGAAADMQQHKH